MNSLLLLLAAVVALLPISEVRGAIPLVIAMANTQLEFYLGIVVSVISNMCIPPVAFKLLDIVDYVINNKKTPLFIKKLYDRVLFIGRKRAFRLKTSSYVALAVFVGIPFPATGAWTGTLVAFLLGMDRRKAILYIMLGVLLASLIVLATSMLGLEILKRVLLL